MSEEAKVQRVPMVLRLPPEDRDALVEISNREGRSYGEVISRLLLRQSLTREAE